MVLPFLINNLARDPSCDVVEVSLEAMTDLLKVCGGDDGGFSGGVVIFLFQVIGPTLLDEDNYAALAGVCFCSFFLFFFRFFFAFIFSYFAHHTFQSLMMLMDKNAQCQAKIKVSFFLFSFSLSLSLLLTNQTKGFGS